MKINAKLFLLVFTIITFISVTSAFIYHTLTQQLLITQQSKALVNSANDFIFEFQKYLLSIDEEFQQNINTNSNNIFDSNIDFVFEVSGDTIINTNNFLVKEDVQIYKDVFKLSDFLKYNSNIILRHSKSLDNDTYYGVQLNIEVIKSLSEKIRAEVALVEDNVVSVFTNNDENKYYLPYLSKVSRELKTKNNFELLYERIDDVDISATHFSPKASVTFNKEMDFIIFNISKEAASFKNTMNIVTAVIVISGIFLTIIFLFLFTAKFRKQLEFISNGVKNISNGEMNDRVKIISNDEIGNLGNAFNNMLDEIEKKDLAEKEYSEFISLINQNPSLEEIGDATLRKIINSTKVDVGAFYIHENNELIPFAVMGLPNKKQNIIEEASFYKRAIDEKEIIEIQFQENHPIIKTGIAELKIDYLYIIPIFYNNEIIAIMELASVNKPKTNIKEYLDKIKDQLAIGLANGKALSELKKLVEELRNLNSAYQEQNLQITEKNEELLKLHEKLKLGSKELEIQTAKAVESERIKSQFLANMSHELRTPQNSILGLTELILKDKSTSIKTKERLNVVLRNGKKLLTLIENILEYSKLESGNKEIKVSTVRLNDLVNEVNTFISPLFFERKIDFSIQKPVDFDYELETDIKKIEQIIYNLIGNASKFTESGHVKLKFIIKNSDLIIVVEDTGPGISQEDHKIIFEEFRQTDANLNRKFSGTGLGLAICKRYTDLLNGTIDVNSTIGTGSVFTVKLPNVIKSKTEFPVLLKSIPKETESKLTVLIVSDGIESINLIKDYLKSNNIQVEVKSSNQININSIIDINPSIIIIDILFHQNNGWNYLIDIKTNPSSSETPIVVVNMDEEANCGLGLNVYEYIAQPLDKINIYRAVEQIEENQSIKFRKLLFVLNQQNFDNIEHELLSDELKIYHYDGKNTNLNQIKRYEPDLVIIDLFDKEINSFKILMELNEDLYTKCIPVIAFINRVDDEYEQKIINNSLLETTLINQYHPLDVLKVIKDRIELFDNSVFESENKIIALKDKSFSKIESKSNGKIKVLVVDDDDDARFTIGEILQNLGYQPIFAKNGFECLDMLKSEDPDLVLLDIMMPQMDGFQTIKKIRENEKYNNLEVYALTAYAMLTDKEIIEKNGFDGLFTKPINTLQLERKLNKIIDAIS